MYQKYAVTKRGKIGLYVQLLKALYSCLHSALLLYKKLLTNLESRGFELKPYDPCIVVKTINSKNFPITWHVENMRLSHTENKVVEKIIKWMKRLYGDDMIIYRVKKTQLPWNEP